MRLTLAVLVPAVILTTAGLAFSAAVCLATASAVWLAHRVVRALAEPVITSRLQPERRQ